MCQSEQGAAPSGKACAGAIRRCRYYLCAYTHLDFRNAIATVDCEISIEFSDDGSLSNIKLESAKLLNKWDMSLNLDEAEIEEKDIPDYSEDDFLAEQAEAAEEFYKH